MPKYIVTEIRSYKVQAESLGDCKFVWKQYKTEQQFEDDVEFLNGDIEYVEGAE